MYTTSVLMLLLKCRATMVELFADSPTTDLDSPVGARVLCLISHFIFSVILLEFLRILLLLDQIVLDKYEHDNSDYMELIGQNFCSLNYVLGWG